MRQQSSFVILIFLFVTLLAACKVKDISTPPATLTSIVVTPTDPSIAPGTTTQLTAIGTYSSGSKQNITSTVVWDSSDIGIAAISNSPGSRGLVTAAAAVIGTAVITASSGGITGSTTLTTSHVSLMKVDPPAPPSIAPGTTLQLTAIGTLSDSNSTQQNLTTFATWTSADPGVGTVSDTAGFKGLATAVSAVTATTTITAAYDGHVGSASFTSSPLTSIALSPSSASIAKGTTQQFTATGTLQDTNTQIFTTFASWSTSTAGIATISNSAGSQGLATAVSVGTSTIVASFSGIMSNPATLTVTPAVITSITVTPTNPSIVLGTTRQFIAMATLSDNTTQDVSSSVTWNSSTTGVATIGNASGSKGLATSVGTGSSIITATLGTISGTTTLTVTAAVLTSIAISPASASISTIETQLFTAVGNDSNGNQQNLTTQVTWISSDPTIATISNVPGFQGQASWGFINTGTVTITATFGGITSTPASLTVHF